MLGVAASPGVFLQEGANHATKVKWPCTKPGVPSSPSQDTESSKRIRKIGFKVEKKLHCAA